MLEGLDVEALVGVEERQQVDGGEIAGRVVKEHVLGARIGGADLGRTAAQVCQSLMVVWNWMPGSAEAQAA